MGNAFEQTNCIVATESHVSSISGSSARVPAKCTLFLEWGLHGMILLVDSILQKVMLAWEDLEGASLLLARFGVRGRPLLVSRPADARRVRRMMSRVPRHLVLSVAYEVTLRDGICRVASWCVGLGVECVTVYGRSVSKDTEGDQWDLLAESFLLACNQFWPDMPTRLVRRWEGMHGELRHSLSSVTFFEFEFGENEVNGCGARRFVMRIVSAGVGREALLHAARRLSGGCLEPKYDDEMSLEDVERISSLISLSKGLDRGWKNMEETMRTLSYICKSGKPVEPELLLYFCDSPGLNMGGYPPWEVRFTEIVRVGCSVEGMKYSKLLSMFERHGRSVQNFGR